MFKRFFQAGFALAVSLLLVAPVSGQELSVCDYVASKNQLTSLRLNGSYHQFDDRYADDRKNADNGSLELNGLTWMDNPSWGYRLEGSANVQFSSTDVEGAYSLNGDSDFRRYLRDQIFVFGGFDSIGTPLGSGFTVSVLGGGGYGRFKNVTPMAKAFEISRLLQQRGVLEDAPSDEDLLAIAQIIDEQEGAGLSAELASELQSQLGVSIEVDDVVALDALLRQNLSRFCGWDATISLGYELITPTESSQPILRARANYSTAIDPLSQLVANVRFTKPLTNANSFQLGAGVSYDRALSAIADLSLSYSFAGRGEVGEDELMVMENTHILNSSLQLRASSALSVLFKGQLSHSTGFEEPEWTLDISFVYRLF